MSYIHDRNTSEAPEWEQYVSALTARFGTEAHIDPIVELMHLRQLYIPI